MFAHNTTVMVSASDVIVATTMREVRQVYFYARVPGARPAEIDPLVQWWDCNCRFRFVVKSKIWWGCMQQVK
jgi:hypothetical protein